MKISKLGKEEYLDGCFVTFYCSAWCRLVKSYKTKNEHGQGFSCVEAFPVPNFLVLVRIGTVWMILAETTENNGKYKKIIERGKAFAVNSVPQGVSQRHRYLVCLFVLVVRSHLTVTAGMCPHRKHPKKIPQSLPLGVAWYLVGQLN